MISGHESSRNAPAARRQRAARHLVRHLVRRLDTPAGAALLLAGARVLLGE